MTDPIVIAQAVGFLPALASKTPYTRSRLALLRDGTTKPVLILLAEVAFPEYDSEAVFPFWIDGDPSNEILRNVGLAERKRYRKLELGVPSTDPAYRKLWQQENRSRIAEYAQRFRLRRRVAGGRQ